MCSWRRRRRTTRIGTMLSKSCRKRSLWVSLKFCYFFMNTWNDDKSKSILWKTPPTEPRVFFFSRTGSTLTAFLFLSFDDWLTSNVMLKLEKQNPVQEGGKTPGTLVLSACPLLKSARLMPLRVSWWWFCLQDFTKWLIEVFIQLKPNKVETLILIFWWSFFGFKI